MSGYGDSLGAFDQSRDRQCGDSKPYIVAGIPQTFQPELALEMMVLLRIIDPRPSSVVLLHRAFLDRIFLVSG